MKFFGDPKVALFLLGLAAVFLIVGIFRGEAEAVWMKAIRICMECIGLG